MVASVPNESDGRGKSTAAQPAASLNAHQSGNQLDEIRSESNCDNNSNLKTSFKVLISGKSGRANTVLYRSCGAMTHCDPQGALPVSRTISLQNVALLIACLLLSDCLRESAGGNAGLQTEEYTVWPKKTAEPLSEGYPWKSCNDTTGGGCPGLSDYIHHFCVDYGNAGCPRKNKILAEKRVILNLLPGEHKMAFWRSFSMTLWTVPQCHLFCNVSELTIRGTHVSETTILAVKMKVLKWFKSDGEGDGLHDHANPCKWSSDCSGKSLPRSAEWSAFAFRGGGNVTFQDITFRSLSSSPEKYGENFISAWDLRRFEVRRCHFPELRQWRGALALLMSEYVDDTGKPRLVEMVVNDSTFGFEVDVESNAYGSVFASPAIAVMSLEICETTFPWDRAYGKFSAKLHQCAFQLYFAEDAQCRER